MTCRRIPDHVTVAARHGWIVRPPRGRPARSRSSRRRSLGNSPARASPGPAGSSRPRSKLARTTDELSPFAGGRPRRKSPSYAIPSDASPRTGGRPRPTGCGRRVTGIDSAPRWTDEARSPAGAASNVGKIEFRFHSDDVFDFGRRYIDDVDVWPQQMFVERMITDTCTQVARSASTINWRTNE